MKKDGSFYPNDVMKKDGSFYIKVTVVFPVKKRPFLSKKHPRQDLCIKKCFILKNNTFLQTVFLL